MVKKKVEEIVEVLEEPVETKVCPNCGEEVPLTSIIDGAGLCYPCAGQAVPV